MKKKLAVGILSATLLVGGATAALGATDPSKLADIKSLTQQMFGIHQQIIDKEVEAGLITQQQGDSIKQFATQREQAAEQALANGQVFGPGMGMRMRGGWFNNNGQPLTDAQKQALTDAMQARLKAIQDGTFVPGPGGHGGPWGGAGPWGTTAASQNSTTN